MRSCRRIRAALILVAFVVAGCAEAPLPIINVAPDMVAKASPAKPPPTESRFGEQALVVAPATGVGSPSGNGDAVAGPTIPVDTFRAALIESLQDAALF